MTGGTSATVAALSAAATITSAVVAANNKPKKAKEPTMPMYTPTPTEDTAKQKLEAEEQLRQRKGRASTLLQGEGDTAFAATTQSGGKTLLGQ